MVKWWSEFKIFNGKKEHQEKVDILKNTEAIVDFLQECPQDVKLLLQEFAKLEELERERRVMKEQLAEANLEAQSRMLDKLITQYEFFQNDVDINGLRLKKIAQQFLENAHHAGLHDLVKAKKKDSKWQFYW